MTSTTSNTDVDETKSLCSKTCDIKLKPREKKTSSWSRFKAISSLSCVTLGIFAIDFLLLGHAGETASSWVSFFSFVHSNNYFAFDACCAIFVLALIVVQMVRRSHLKGSSQGKATSESSVKNSRPTRRQDESSPREATGATAAAPHVPPVSKLNQAIDLATKKGDLKKAGDLLREFEQQGDGKVGNRPDTVSYNLIIRAFAKKADCQGAEHWLWRMKSSGVEPTVCTYNTVLDACAKANKAEACDAWLGKMLGKGLEANVISYATVIHAWARRGDEARAEAWMTKMLDAKIEPDAVSYNSMIHACGGNGNSAGAERWIKELLARGLEASVTTFTAVIDACAKGGDVPRAEKWLEEMIAAKVQPNVVTFSSMIDACAKACDPTRAEFWHDRMIECNVTPNAHSFSAVINACAKVGDVDRAEKWLGNSEKAGIVNDVVIYSSVIDACGKANDPERALLIFQRMQDHGIQPHIVAYAALARPYAYRGDYAQVERIAQEMAARGVVANEYFLYAQLLSYATTRPRQVQRAEDCFRKANRSGLKANDHVVSALARAIGRDRCMELMDELCNGRSVPLPPARREGNANNKAKPLPRRQQ